jgi:hypothetical protein
MPEISTPTEQFQQTPAEQYELEIYKRLKSSGYFKQYIDTFLNQRSERLVESLSHFPLELRNLVLPVFHPSLHKTSSSTILRTQVWATWKKTSLPLAFL